MNSSDKYPRVNLNSFPSDSNPRFFLYINSFSRTVTFSQQQVALGKAPRSGVRCVSLPNSKIENFLHPLRRSLVKLKVSTLQKMYSSLEIHVVEFRQHCVKFQMRILSGTVEGNYEQRLIGKSARLAVFSGQFMNDSLSPSTSNLFC